MKRAIGFKVKGMRRDKIIAWRNYFVSAEPCPDWEYLVSKGLAKRYFGLSPESSCYLVTKEGIAHLAEIIEVTIVED